MLTAYGSSTSDDMDEFRLDETAVPSHGRTPGNELLSPPPSPRNDADQACGESTATSHQGSAEVELEGDALAAVAAMTAPARSQISSDRVPHRQLGRASFSAEALQSTTSPPIKMKKPKRRAKSVS